MEVALAGVEAGSLFKMGLFKVRNSCVNSPGLFSAAGDTAGVAGGAGDFFTEIGVKIPVRSAGGFDGAGVAGDDAALSVFAGSIFSGCAGAVFKDWNICVKPPGALEGDDPLTGAVAGDGTVTVGISTLLFAGATGAVSARNNDSSKSSTGGEGFAWEPILPNIPVALDGSLPADSLVPEKFGSSNGNLDESMQCAPQFQNKLVILKSKLTSQNFDSKALTPYDTHTN